MKYQSLFILIVLMLSCHGSKNDYSVRFKFTDLKVDNAHNLGELPEITSLDSIPANAYVIRAYLFPEIISEGQAHVDYDHPPENFNRLDSIVITSNADFSQDQPAGSSLNDNFLYFAGSYFYVYELDGMPITNYWNEDYKDDPIPDEIDLMLMTPPTEPSSHIFTVQGFFHDGSVHFDSTAEIKLY